MSTRLERAWNSSDADTLALFADDARVITAWGRAWEGRSQLSSFLRAFFDQGPNIRARPLQTLAQCEDGHTIVWTFRYPSGVNSAMIATVENNQVATLFWELLPYPYDLSQSDSASSLPGGEAPASAALAASAIALAGAGLMYLVLLSDRPKRAAHVRGELHSALRAGLQLRAGSSGPDRVTRIATAARPPSA
jgi:hypothetical protein